MFRVSKEKFIRTILLALFVLVAICAYLSFTTPPGEYDSYKKTTLIIEGRPYTAAIADTDTLREQGLSGKRTLPMLHAMLFVFDTPNQYGFWMKDMLFPIDIIWLNADKEVVRIAPYVDPASYPATFSPDEDALYVLEVPVGDSQKYNFAVGQKATFVLP